ncbi:MAG: hypothetical protein SNJ75_07750 [Gemmataceae bacterium]
MKRIVLITFAYVVASGLVGCNDLEPIRTEVVPKPPTDMREPKVRLLAAILEHRGEQWFFKLVGPIKDVEDLATPYTKFIESVRLTGDKDNPITWTVPAGWQPGPKKELRFATFLPENKPGVEITVYKFDRTSGLLENINRWNRLDLGRAEIRSRDLEKVTQKVRAGEHLVTLVDLTGPGVDKKPNPHAGLPPKQPRKLPIEYTAPPEWEETGPRESAFVRYFTVFVVQSGPPKIEMTVSRMVDRGSLLENVNRWRAQVKLAPINELTEPPSIDLNGVKGQYFDLQGNDQRMLLVRVVRGEETWFFKLLADKETVAKNKEIFDRFMRSVRFVEGE